MNKVHIRLIILSLLLTVLATIGTAFQVSSTQQSVRSIFQVRQAEKESLFDQLLKLKSSTLLSYAYDYTYWDDMVALVEESGQEDFAKKNIDPSLDTYKSNAVWVFRPDFTKVYATNNLEDEGLNNFPLSGNLLQQVFGNNLFPHFYVKSGSKLLEIAGAPIQPTNDVERKSSPRGYFLAGRVWDQIYLTELSKFMDGDVEFPHADEDPNLVKSNASRGIIIFDRDLNGFDGRSITQIHMEIKAPAIELLSKAASNQLVYTLFSSGLSLLLAIVGLFVWVVKPLGLVSRSLTDSNPAVISSLLKKKDEFGQIANLITKFFEQKDSLEREVSEHFRAAKEMQRQKDETERINKTMIDRELKMVELKKEIEALKDKKEDKDNG